MNALESLLQNNPEYSGQTFQQRLNHYNVVGCSIAIIDGNKIEDMQFGYVSKDREKKVNHATLFQAASISKFVFGALVMKLQENGVLNINDDIGKYLNAFTLQDRFKKTVPATINQLMSHTGGTNVHGFKGYDTHQFNVTTKKILKGEWPVNSNPVYKVKKDEGRFKYSGGGTMIVQKCVENATNKSIDDLSKNLVFKPLTMGYSTFDQPLPRTYKNVACGHSSSGRKVKNCYRYYPEKAAAGLWTTASDLAVFGRALIHSYQHHSSLLSKQSILSMSEVMYDQKIFNHDPHVRVGVGCFVHKSNDNIIIGHSGSNEGYVSLCAFSITKSKGFTIMLNSDNAHHLLYEFQKAFTRIYHLA